VIRSVTNEVLVPVVVLDARGHAVGNLRKDEFEVFDNGKAQTITGFTIIGLPRMPKRNRPLPVLTALPPFHRRSRQLSDLSSCCLMFTS
jgi:hypothetical protein